MPGKTSELHLEMLLKERDGQLYGLQWGDPDRQPNLEMIRDIALLPHVGEGQRVVEIGPGGGRWTRYMKAAGRIYAVDPFQDLLDELAKNFADWPNLELVLNEGSDLPGIEDGSIDFVFTFGVFVHLDPDVVEGYLREIARVLHPEGRAFMQYSDKTKPRAFRNRGFAVNHPAMMREMLDSTGFTIEWENTTALPHSACVMCHKRREGESMHMTGQLPPLPAQYYPVRS